MILEYKVFNNIHKYDVITVLKDQLTTSRVNTGADWDNQIKKEEFQHLLKMYNKNIFDMAYCNKLNKMPYEPKIKLFLAVKDLIKQYKGLKK